VSGELHPPIVLFRKCVWYKFVSKLPRPQKKFELRPVGTVPLNMFSHRAVAAEALLTRKDDTAGKWEGVGRCNRQEVGTERSQ